MSVVKMKDLVAYVTGHGGTIVQITNGNYNMRGPNGSYNIGKPKNGRWDSAQFTRAWGDATGIPKPPKGTL